MPARRDFGGRNTKEIILKRSTRFAIDAEFAGENVMTVQRDFYGETLALFSMPVSAIIRYHIGRKQHDSP